jgi:hypothetical protein
MIAVWIACRGPPGKKEISRQPGDPGCLLISWWAIAFD